MNTNHGRPRGSRLARFAAALLTLAASSAVAEVKLDAQGQITQDSLLGSLEVRDKDFDVEGDRMCIHNAGVSGDWKGGDYELSLAVMLPPDHGLTKADVIVSPPVGLEIDIEVQPGAILLDLRPAGDSFRFEAGSETCVEFMSIDLTDNLPYGIGKGGPLPAARATR